MSAFPIDRLREVMRECGVDDAVDLDGDILDLEFAQLGYDSTIDYLVATCALVLEKPRCCCTSMPD